LYSKQAQPLFGLQITQDLHCHMQLAAYVAAASVQVQLFNLDVAQL
jgi:hypothetical protein